MQSLSLLKIISLGLTVSMKALSLDFDNKNNTSQNIQELRGLIEHSTQSLHKAISLSADRVADF
jgi:regulatory protein YycH of two-component signal transduction system YycFG